MTFGVWLLSLSIIFSRFIHVVACIRTSFFFIAKLDSTGWLYHILFIHSSADEHLDYFHFCAIMNYAAMKLHIQDFMWPYALIFLQYISSSGVTGNSVYQFKLFKI